MAESGSGSSTGGRRPGIVRFRPNARFLLAADLRPGLLRVALTDLDTRILHEHSLRLERRTAREELLPLIEGALRSVMPDEPDRGRITGVGLSLPGTVHPERLFMEFAPNLGLRNISFEPLEEAIGLPLFLENEANAAALAELRLVPHSGVRHLIYVSVIRGIGVGIVVDGRLYRGARGNAGEFGHMTFVPGGRVCSCGKRGCWERYASERALADEFHLRGRSGGARSFEQLARRIAKGDADASDVLETVARNLAVGLGNLAAGLDPDLVVVGGDILQCGKRVGERLSELLPGVRVRLSATGEDASLRGVALLPRARLFGPAFARPLL
ncbi:ROK family protein [Salinispira pacifica]